MSLLSAAILEGWVLDRGSQGRRISREGGASRVGNVAHSHSCASYLKLWPRWDEFIDYYCRARYCHRCHRHRQVQTHHRHLLVWAQKHRAAWRVIVPRTCSPRTRMTRTSELEVASVAEVTVAAVSSTSQGSDWISLKVLVAATTGTFTFARSTGFRDTTRSSEARAAISSSLNHYDLVQPKLWGTFLLK